MANHASHAALPYPIKGARFTLAIPYLDADGDPTDPTTPDTEISKDDAAAADATEEVASPKNSIGMLTLSGDEMNCSMLTLAAKAASGPKTTLATLYPRVLAVLTSGTADAGTSTTLTLQFNFAGELSGCFIKTTGGTGGGGGSGSQNNQVRRIKSHVLATKVVTVEPAFEVTPDSTTTYEILLPEGATRQSVGAVNPDIPGRTLGVEADGMILADLQEWQGTAPLGLSSQRVQSHVGSLADGVLTAAKFAAGAFDAVWAVATRLLTAGTNIVLAKGVGVTGFNDIAAADVWAVGTRTLTGVGSSGIALEASLATVFDLLNPEIANILVTTDRLATAIELDGAVWRFTTNALEQSPAGGGGTTQRRVVGSVAGSGTNVRIEFWLIVDGIPALGAALSAAVVNAVSSNGASLGFSLTSATIDASGLVRIYGTITAPVANRHVVADVQVTHGGSARTGFCAGVVLAA